ncbi:MAG: lamin tail domain-containing protein [Bacteroidales bacterium]
MNYNLVIVSGPFMKKPLKYALLTIVSCFLLTAMKNFAQVSENFSDGNFFENPAWFGDTAMFKISTSSAIPDEMKPALQLDGSDSDTSIMYLANQLIENTEWKFWVKLSFNTSANNFARVYLVSDSPELKGPLNGYFLQIGGANDSIGLYKQTTTSEELIIQAENLYSGNSTNLFRFKVLRDGTGNWQLFADIDGGSNFLLEGTGFDDTFLTTSYFGLYCKYTSSNATKFYFDDLFVYESGNDTIPPKITSVSVLNQNELLLSFSEEIEQGSAENSSHYFVSDVIGNPVNAALDAQNPTRVILTFENFFLPGLNYLLLVSNISDLAGNIMVNDTIGFIYFENSPVEPFSILINEVMADVSPSPNGLPESDYIELFNTTSDTIKLAGFRLKPRESADPILIPETTLYPDSFLILTSSTDTSEFLAFGQVAGLPGFSLNNEGTIILRNPAGELIHSIVYDKSWYQNADKEEGGWSIEQIDPFHPCSGKSNWTSSINESGGTPGYRNSVDGTWLSYLTVLSVETHNNHAVKIQFSHVMDSLSLTNLNAYSIDQGIGNPESVYLDEILSDYAILEFSAAFDTNIVYHLSLTDTLFNCSGQDYLSTGTYDVILPAIAKPFEVVINEIMFDPEPPVGLPEFEFIEIFNTTGQYLDIKNWILEVGTVQKSIPDFVIEPNGFTIFTVEEAKFLFSLYGSTFGFSSLGLSNSGATLNLKDQNEQIICSVSYSPSWLGDTQKEGGGWSLEQIDPFYPCAGEGNWSVSISEKGGTPGSINSVDAPNQLVPLIERIIANSVSSVEVYFNQAMDKSSLLEPAAYSIDLGIGNPSTVVPGDETGKKVLLYLENNLVTKTLYTLSVDLTLENCVGVEMPESFEFTFGVHEPAVQNDLVINEILFNPVGNGVDFVEIYNRSDKIINIFDLALGDVSLDQFGNSDTSYKTVSDESRLILTGNYLVLTTDPRIVKDQYHTENPDGFVKMASFPSYSNTSGKVVLLKKSGYLIDAMDYDEAMHHPLLSTVEGVSLERIHYDRPGKDVTNWHSAASASGYATPAYQNSQFTSENPESGEVTVEPDIFSPDNDGYNDVLNIHYLFTTPGNTASIAIYDAEGRLINYLVQNEILGTVGTISWDGRTTDNQKANIGIYLIYFEVFDLNGNVKKYKRTAVLAGKI